MLALKQACVAYTDVCKDGNYICFRGKILHSALDMHIGLHFRLGLVDYIELFRPKEYYSEQYDINKSFSEIQQAVKALYGAPLSETIKPLDGLSGSTSEWNTSDFMIQHSICDRFGPEEHFSFRFK